MSFFNHKITRTVGAAIVIAFALFGFVLTVGFFAVKFGLTNVPGAIDLNDRALSITNNPNQAITSDLQAAWCSVSVLQEKYPVNAGLILQYLREGGNPAIAVRMVDAVLPYTTQSSVMQSAITQCVVTKKQVALDSAIYWMNTPEWQALREAIRKDLPALQKAANASGVSPRLIAAQLIAEQMRLFTSDRELFKQVFAPLKILGAETQFSLGVTGVKEETAIAVEQNVKNPTSPYYLGTQYEHLLDFENPQYATNERIARITNSKNHYYSYLYTGLFLHQVQTQWKNAGFDIVDKPEIASTLFNIGFAHSNPNGNPQVGGAEIAIDGRTYTFGRLASDFYYSGELQDILPL